MKKNLIDGTCGYSIVCEESLFDIKLVDNPLVILVITVEICVAMARLLPHVLLKNIVKTPHSMPYKWKGPMLVLPHILCSQHAIQTLQ